MIGYGKLSRVLIRAEPPKDSPVATERRTLSKYLYVTENSSMGGSFHALAHLIEKDIWPKEISLQDFRCSHQYDTHSVVLSLQPTHIAHLLVLAEHFPTTNALTDRPNPANDNYKLELKQRFCDSLDQIPSALSPRFSSV
ncbi:hypothetical protein FQN60_015987 [Etheostoma spectabile]|uniref:Uncharacterized protein n=1 Tax=Etheostoma spectabile TaxID=54343 RepID=A0A5J5CVR7_9PERO|nr:hypothetical protein FQN60_015987 [Etheostoma spectabile]